MEIVDKEKLEIAIQYVQRITEGHNPVNNMPVDDDSVINNANVVRCMYFVKDVLEKVYKNEGYIGRIPRKLKDDGKEPYPIEILKEYKYTGDKTITKMVNQMNELVDNSKYTQISFNSITKWLVENGYLQVISGSYGVKKSKSPTEKGMEIGIRTEKRFDANGYQFDYVEYDQNAQRFIVENMGKILGRE